MLTCYLISANMQTRAFSNVMVDSPRETAPAAARQNVFGKHKAPQRSRCCVLAAVLFHYNTHDSSATTLFALTLLRKSSLHATYA